MSSRSKNTTIILAVLGAIIFAIVGVFALCNFLSSSQSATAAQTRNAKSDVTLEATKTTDWTDDTKSEADVTITAKTNETISSETPNILFIGTMCKAHSLDEDKLTTSINALTSIGNVDYYLLNNSNFTANDKSGYLTKGTTFAETITMRDSGNHQALGKFLDAIYEKCVTAGKEYDNIVFEFDSSRIAESYGTATNPTSTHEADVVELLKNYYTNNKVIWIVDKGTGTSNLYRPTKWFARGTGEATEVIEEAQYKSLLGLTAPAYYESASTYYTDDSFPAEYALKANRQLLYSATATEIKTTVENAIKNLIYSYTISDTLIDASQITIMSYSAQISSDGVTWAPYTDCTIVQDGQTIKLQTPQLTGLNYIKLIIHVKVTENFKVTDKVSDTPDTLKSPNNGSASIVMTTQASGTVTKSAELAKDKYLDWSISEQPGAYSIDTEVVDGEITTSKWAGPNAEVKITYSTETGLPLTAIIVDGQEVSLETYKDGYTFSDINQAHTIKVVYGTDPVTYTVKFVDSDDLSEIYPSISVEEGNTVDKPSDPTKEGFTFGGWYTDNECTESFDFSTPVTENITLYAKWLNEYSVKFVDSQDETIVYGECKVVEGKTISKPDDPSKTGYVFAGWYGDKNLTKVFDFSTSITEDTVVYAKFNKQSEEVVPTPITTTTSTPSTFDIALSSIALVVIGIFCTFGSLSLRHRRKNGK